MAVSRARTTHGCTLVAPLVGAALGLAALAGVTAALAQAAAWVRRADARAEMQDTADLVLQAFAFDLRGAGWRPAGPGGARLVAASPTALELHVDLDGDGAIDPTSAERVRWRLAPASGSVSRLLGDQSMPLASIATEAAFDYRDDGGGALAAPSAGLAPNDLTRVRAVTLSFTLVAPGGQPVVRREVAVALRGEPT